MSMILRLELYVRDLEKSIAFYQDVVQLKLQAMDKTGAMFTAPNLKLLLTQQNIILKDHYFGDLTSAQKGLGVEIIIVVNDIQESYKRISSMPVKLEANLTKQYWGMTDFRLTDPDGYYLRMTSSKMNG